MSGNVPQVGSSGVTNIDAVFSCEELLSLLTHIRGSSVPSEMKFVFRDLVLEYAQSDSKNKSALAEELLDALDDFPEDFATQIALLQKSLQKVSEAPVAPVVTTNKVKTGFGKTRPRPAFSGTAMPQVSVSTPIPDVQPMAEQEEVAQTETIADITPEAHVVPATAETDSPVDHLDRIKEIKKLVNEKVGNPVNLIDANNEVGREYMNALLDAMKKVHGGEAAAVTSAMQRLEAAYSSVEETLKTTPLDTVAPAEVAEPATEEVTEPVSGFATQTEEVVEKVVASPAVNPEATSVATEPPATPVPQNVAPVAQSVATEPVAETTSAPAQPEPVQTPEPVAPASEVVPPTAGLQSLAVEDTTPAPAAPETEAEAGIESVEPDVQTPAPEATPAASATTDPLMDPKITSGLDQLLSEWSLFKSSGLFGTGPSGREHPLYKKLAALPMSSVVSGRFEGASAEVKQSLTDYMNGWRYEQGMVHEIEETFEHYLRRVIQAILAKQPKAE